MCLWFITTQHPYTLARLCQLLVRSGGPDKETWKRRSFGYWQSIRPLAARLANGISIAFRLL
jgi:hypothetical protein